MRLLLVITASLTAGVLWGCSPAETAKVETPDGTQVGDNSDGGTPASDLPAANGSSDAGGDGSDAAARELTLTYYDMPG